MVLSGASFPFSKYNPIFVPSPTIRLIYILYFIVIFLLLHHQNELQKEVGLVYQE